MAAISEPTAHADPTAQRTDGDAFRREMEATGAELSQWANGPGDRYGIHAHPYRKMLYCAAGSIVFHLPDRDVALAAGARMEIAPGTPHSADVGPAGVRCIEAHSS